MDSHNRKFRVIRSVEIDVGMKATVLLSGYGVELDSTIVDARSALDAILAYAKRIPSLIIHMPTYVADYDYAEVSYSGKYVEGDIFATLA